jgi:putative glutamine amidotransferase
LYKQVLLTYREADKVLPYRNTLLSTIAGTDTWQVNSRHHQVVRTIAGNPRVSAFDAEDRTVEALDHPNPRFVFAVQWHPEDQARIDPVQ